MVANIGTQATNVEAARYLNLVAGFAAVVLLVLLFVNRKWCYVIVFGAERGEHRSGRAAASQPTRIHNAPFNALSKPIHYPDRIFTFEATDSDDELRLQIHQDGEGIECRYEEKNENAASGGGSGAVDAAAGAGAELAGVETALRETRIDEVVAPYVPAPAEYVHTLEAQSSVDSDVIAHNDTSLLCGDTGGNSSGSLELTLLYDAPVRSMTLHVLQARTLPNKNAVPNMQSQVRVLLLPMKKQKYKSKIRYGENPQFMESFVFHKINPEDVHSLSLRVRIYGCERMRRQRLLGEAIVSFASLNLEQENSLWVLLAPRRHHAHFQLPNLEFARTVAGVMGAHTPVSPAPTPLMTSSGLPGSVGAGGGEVCSLARSDSASSCCSARSAAPELLLGLAYSPITGHLSVEVIKGTHFRKLSPRTSPDTYVKLCLVSSLGLEMGRCKSSTRRAQSNPLYKELFIFQVALFQVSEVTLMVSVWWRRSVKKNEMVGWFSLGLNSSGQEEAKHWQEVCEASGDQIQRWHVLMDS